MSDPLDEAMLSALQSHAKRREQQRDEEDAFMDSCALRLKKLPTSMKGLVQLKFSEILYKAENPDKFPDF